ncbi:hypothetical protein HAZT_HAZT004704 [Hyalella azteca]|uniref:Major facilitator superfamily associated domain-containing protein n=1 Tax=Hyalella azteca TaxID=294128 RepID=A0A6A0GXP7_HYAAZ|nr:hypothetical protein HAZT_HAZT004704 [Hyalella azteca]
MKINRDTVLIKAHYFFFFAGMVPVLPFSMVLGLGLGVPIILQGLMAAVVLVGTVIAKPILSLIADTFPRSRRIIFIASILMCGLVSVKCNAGQQEGLGCQPVEVWTKMGFWAFFSLMMIGMISFCTANSFSDAVTIETIGPSGNYGSQRAWGSLGWGLMGPVSGLLVDWWSGYAELKDYTPAYLLVFLIMGVDVVLSSNLKVPKLDAERNVWSSVWPLLQEPRFFLFLLFSVLNGCFDGVVLNFLFVLQEDMAAGSAAVQNIKFLQGITIFVQCATEVPCMFFSHVLVKKIGADRVTTLVLGLHAIRLYLITCVGTWGNVWLTVAVEVLNGPCYGLGYSAIVVYAGQLAPPGASTTVQSLANICYESIGP